MFGSDTAVFQFTGPFGVRVEIGQSLAMLVVFILLMAGGNFLNGALFAAMLVLAIFLHEFGHVAGCLLQGVPVRRVVLCGGGGFCEPARAPTRAEAELIVVLGPLVNLALWALASLAFKSILMGDLFYSSTMMTLAGYLNMFAFMNLALFIFNMLPVQPLDGGRLLHLGLLRVLPQGQALRVAGAVGLVSAALWIPAMIMVYVYFHWILFFMPSIIGHLRMAKGEQS